MQLMYIAAMATAELRSLARDLSRSWHELGGILTSRRLQALAAHRRRPRR